MNYQGFLKWAEFACSLLLYYSSIQVFCCEKQSFACSKCGVARLEGLRISQFGLSCAWHQFRDVFTNSYYFASCCWPNLIVDLFWRVWYFFILFWFPIFHSYLIHPLLRHHCDLNSVGFVSLPFKYYRLVSPLLPLQLYLILP